MVVKPHVILLLSFVWCVFGALPNKQRMCGNGPTGPKVNVSETVLAKGEWVDDGGIHFASANNQIILVRTISGKIFRSQDEGYSWDIVNTTESGGVSRIYSTESKGDITIYLVGSVKGLYSSGDGGATFTFYNSLALPISAMLPHPTLKGYALASLIGSSQVLYTDNSGATWTKILDAYGTFYWSIFTDVPSDKRIYALVPDVTRFSVVYSDNFFQDVHKLSVTGAIGMRIYAPNKFVVLTCSSADCISKQLYVSDDAGSTFNLVRFPDVHGSEQLEETNIGIPEISDDAIWIYTQRSCDPSCWGDLFHSTAADRDFALALRYSLENQFTKYYGLDGIYVSNQFITKGSLPQANDLVRTLITYNKGSRWNLIKAPETSGGQPTNCDLTAGCSLHLNGYRGDHPFTYFYSIPNAPGLMIGTGNLGTHLETQVSNTYISFNGGIDWKEVQSSASSVSKNYVPEIGDYGSTVVMVREDGVTDEIIYTINDGDEWRTCTFTDSAFDVSNIRVDPEWDSKRFILYGTRITNGTGEAVIIQLNFDQEYSGKCTADDFEEWSPKDEHGYCVMGVAKSYKKRKLGKTCYFGEGFQALSRQEACPCTAEDYECDHCFYRPELDSACTLECTIPDIPDPGAGVCDGTRLSYNVSLGYRLVDNNKCDTTSSKSAPKPQGLIPCPTPTTPNPSNNNVSASPVVSILITLFIIVLVAAIIAGAYILYKKNTAVRDFVTYTLGFSPESTTDSTYSTVGQGDTLSST